jgi:polyisoprenoid-binding protein YceI
MRTTMKSTVYQSAHRAAFVSLAALALFGANLAHADVDLAKSSVIATTKQMNVPVDGKFKKFSAQLNFDPAKPAAGTASVSIDITTSRRRARNGSTPRHGPPPRSSQARSRRPGATSTR